MVQVPVIDLALARAGGRTDREHVARQIDTACQEIGFFAITGHGVPDALVDDLRRRAHEFFALPLPEKLRASHPARGTNRGYHPAGAEALSTANDAASPPDLKEFFPVQEGRPRPVGRWGRREPGGLGGVIGGGLGRRPAIAHDLGAPARVRREDAMVEQQVDRGPGRQRGQLRQELQSPPQGR
jgi:hypothetical protein